MKSVSSYLFVLSPDFKEELVEEYKPFKDPNNNNDNKVLTLDQIFDKAKESADKMGIEKNFDRFVHFPGYFHGDDGLLRIEIASHLRKCRRALVDCRCFDPITESTSAALVQFATDSLCMGKKTYLVGCAADTCKHTMNVPCPLHVKRDGELILSLAEAQVERAYPSFSLMCRVYGDYHG